MKNLIYIPAFVFVKVLIFTVSLFPRQVMLFIGRTLGLLTYCTRLFYWAVVWRNINIVFGGTKTKKEMRKVAKGFYKHVGMSIMEVFYDRPLSEDFVQGRVEFVGLENFDNALKKGKGVLGMTAHYGSWEMLGYLMGYKGYSLDSIYNPFKNPYLDTMMRQKRARYGGSPIAKENAVVNILRSLKQNRIVPMLFDQRADVGEAIEVNFFGRPSRTNKGLAMIALRTGAPVVPFFIERTDRGHRITVHEEVELVDTGNRDEDIKVNSEKFNAILEERILAAPEQWYWFLPRWKSGKKRYYPRPIVRKDSK